MYSFMNDYSEGAHERILDALAKTNREQTVGYGCDEHCGHARELIKKQLRARNCEIHFLVGGTQTNTTVIASVLRPHQGVLAAETGHINVHESGAVEATGHKVLPLPSGDGKITAAQVEAAVKAHFVDENAEHAVQPGMVYISNPTEVGTIYKKKELTALKKVCDKYKLPLFLDGARLGCALVSDENDLTLHDLARLCSVFYIGGTKMGAMFGEAVVFSDLALAKDFRYMIKQRGGMLAKGRLLGIQFETLFADDLYFELAKHADAMARKLTAGLRAQGYSFLADSPTNQVFPILSKAGIEALAKEFQFEIWKNIDAEHDAIRLCTSWATEERQVDALLELLAGMKSC